MTPAEAIVADYRRGDLPYSDAYQLLAYALVPNPRALLADERPATSSQPAGWEAVYAAAPVGLLR